MVALVRFYRTVFFFVFFAPSELGVSGAARAPHRALQHVRAVPGGVDRRAGRAAEISGGRGRAVSRRGGELQRRSTSTHNGLCIYIDIKNEIDTYAVF